MRAELSANGFPFRASGQNPSFFVGERSARRPRSSAPHPNPPPQGGREMAASPIFSGQFGECPTIALREITEWLPKDGRLGFYCTLRSEPSPTRGEGNGC